MHTTLSTRPKQLGILTCLLVLTAISLWYYHHNLQKFEGYQQRYSVARLMTTADSEDYRRIAYAFVTGDYSLSHFGSLRPQEQYPLKSSEGHRHPLYPLLLSVGWRLFGGELHVLASVNILVNIATMWLVFVLVWRLFGSLTAGILSALTIPYLLWLSESATIRLMTEPLFVLLVLVTLYYCARFAERPGNRYFYLAIVFSALCYLTRINGLVVFLAVTVTLPAFFVFDCYRGGRERPGGYAMRKVAAMLAGALTVFVLCTAPVWIAKWTHTGNPLFHRYQERFMWSATREEAKTVDPRQLSWKRYLDQHGWQDISRRLRAGFERIFISGPGEIIGRKFYLLALSGLGLGLVLGDRRVLAIVGVTALHIFPIMWTSSVNPTLRIPFAALTPAYVLFIGFLIYTLQRYGRQLLSNRSH